MEFEVRHFLQLQLKLRLVHELHVFSMKVAVRQCD